MEEATKWSQPQDELTSKDGHCYYGTRAKEIQMPMSLPL